MLTKTEKKQLVEELASRFKRKKIAIFSDMRGVSVSKMQALRRILKKTGADYKVAKKTLFDRALETAGTPLKTRGLEGELGVAFGYGDEVTAAKTLLKFSKENETFKILGGILGERILSGKEVLTIARLPAKEVLWAQVVGTLQAPIKGLAVVLQGNIRNLVVVLNKIKDKK